MLDWATQGMIHLLQGLVVREEHRGGQAAPAYHVVAPLLGRDVGVRPPGL